MLSSTFSLVIIVLSFLADGSHSLITHPMLYFSAEDVARLREQALTTHVDIFKDIEEAVNKYKSKPESYLPPLDWEKFASTWNERYGNDLCTLAMYLVLNPKDIKARNLAVRFMDNLYLQPAWRVKYSFHDDVPVAHNLIGMSTAYDFLFTFLDSQRKQIYLEKIKNVTKELYERSMEVWWGTTYIQNHVATNYVALLSGAIVCEVHYSEASVWKNHAHKMLNRTIFLLNYVVDGSMNEGVAYGTYTTRSLTQYGFLALRHFNINLMENSLWFQQYFWSIYHTLLPGYQENVAIGDSNRNWFYGPESQLAFLDSYVLKNGHGNWLRELIRSNRPVTGPAAPGNSQKYCTKHMEFLFYNASIPKVPVPGYVFPTLHAFSDWGVVTYGGGTPLGSPFLSFKAGVLHGEIANKIVNYGFDKVDWLKGWKNFNPGHEHPDHGSFVFVPGNGEPFITDTLYSPKHTWMNNVPVFGPSLDSKCFKPLEGQIGECKQWFDFKNVEAWTAYGQIISASTEVGRVFISGEFAKWYRNKLGLVSVYRSTVLLSPSVLLVIDHIEKLPQSPLTFTTSYFHNINNPFFPYSHPNGYSGGILKQKSGNYHVIWIDSNRRSPKASVGNMVHSRTTTNYIQMSFTLKSDITRTAYVFSGPGNEIDNLHISSQTSGLHVMLDINGKHHNVSVVTDYTNPRRRHEFLQCSGFAKVRIDDKHEIQFGKGTVSLESHENHPLVQSQMIVAVCVFIVLVFVYKQVIRRFQMKKLSRVVLIILLIWLCFSLHYAYVCFGKDCSWSLKDNKSTTQKSNSATQQLRMPESPIVYLSSLPLAGANLYAHLFTPNPDFFYTTFPIGSMPLPRELQTHSQLDPCEWSKLDYLQSRFPISMRMFRSLKSNPINYILQNLNKKSENSFERELYSKLKITKGYPVITLSSAEWTLKLPWLNEILGKGAQGFYVVRDPRSWISAWLRGEPNYFTIWNFMNKLSVMFEKVGTSGCSLFKGYAKDYETLRTVTQQHNITSKPHTLLAMLWQAHTSAALRVNSQLLKTSSLELVYFENLIKKPIETAQKVYRTLEMPMPPAVDRGIKTAVWTGKVLNGIEVVKPDILYDWKEILTEQEVKDIEEICGSLMYKLGYR